MLFSIIGVLEVRPAELQLQYIFSASLPFFTFALPRTPQKGKNSPPLPRPKPLKKKREGEGAYYKKREQEATTRSGRLLSVCGLSGAWRCRLFFHLSGGANKLTGKTI